MKRAYVIRTRRGSYNDTIKHICTYDGTWQTAKFSNVRIYKYYCNLMHNHTYFDIQYTYCNYDDNVCMCSFLLGLTYSSFLCFSVTANYAPQLRLSIAPSKFCRQMLHGKLLAIQMRRSCRQMRENDLNSGELHLN